MAGIGSRPNEADDPGDEGPAEEEVDGEDAAKAGVAAKGGDDGGEEIEYKADTAEAEPEDPVENLERMVKHGVINLPIFCFGGWGIILYFVFQSTFRCRKMGTFGIGSAVGAPGMGGAKVWMVSVFDSAEGISFAVYC